MTLVDGTSYHARCDVPKGDIYKSAMSKEEVLDKFYKNIEFSGAMTRGEADRIVEVVDRLEKLENIEELVSLMR